jgi:transcriptional regulator with XRE-family HTH domain
MNRRDLRQLGQLIRRDRNNCGMPLRDVERITDVTSSTLSRIEQGQIEQPNPLYLVRLAQAFKVPASAYYALAGYLPREALPPPESYLCDYYGMSGTEAAMAKEVLEAMAGKWGKL